MKNSEQYAHIINRALSVKQDIFEQLEDILETKEIMEDDAVVFFQAMSILCKVTAQLARTMSGLPPEQIKQILREDCMRSKIILNEIFPQLIEAVNNETGTTEISKFLQEMEFFEYPDERIARWNLNVG